MKSKLLAMSITPAYKKVARVCYASLLAAGLTITATQPAGAWWSSPSSTTWCSNPADIVDRNRESAG